MNNDLHRLISSAAEMGAAQALHALGLTAGELSQRAAVRTYGKWLADAIAAGRIRPARIEAGHAGTRWFRVADILALQTEYSAQAFLLNSYHNNEKETH
jgi:hypothetical protein